MFVSAEHYYAGHRFPAEIISYAVWLYFRFPLSLRHVDELLATRGVSVSHETVRQWGLKFGQAFANQIRRRLPRAGDKWHLDEVAVKIAGVQHWLWRAVDQDGTVLDILVQSRRDKRAAKRLLRKLLKQQCRPPRVMVTDKLASYVSRGNATPHPDRRATAMGPPRKTPGRLTCGHLRSTRIFHHLAPSQHLCHEPPFRVPRSA